MATIGLDKLYYAKITEDENGDETYATPKLLAKAISADLSVELNEANRQRGAERYCSNSRPLLRGHKTRHPRTHPRLQIRHCGCPR